MTPAHEEAVKLVRALGLDLEHLDGLTKAIEAARLEGAVDAEKRLRPILLLSLELSQDSEKKSHRAALMGKSGLAIALASLAFALSRFL